MDIERKIMDTSACQHLRRIKQCWSTTSFNDLIDNWSQMGSIVSCLPYGDITTQFVNELKQLFLAVPLRSNQKCEIRVFKVK
jgi:hypothetical protein